MTILKMSIAATALILAVVVIRAWAVNRLPKKTFVVLWGVVLCRLLIPVSIPSPFSIYTLLHRAGQGGGSIRDIEAATWGGTLPQIQPGAAPEAAPTVPWAILIWGVGFAACALFFAISYLRSRRQFQAAIPVKDSAVTEWLTAHPTRRAVTVSRSDQISAPLCYGILRPVILLPKRMNLDDEKQLQYVLTHEHTHIRRFDGAAKLLLTAALCVHWFNPLVWVMAALANRDIELSCDEAVVRDLGESAKSAYARVLIGMEESKSGFLPLCMNFSKNAIEERITAIMKMKKATIPSVLTACLVIVSMTTVFATSAVANQGGMANIPPSAREEGMSGDTGKAQAPLGTEAEYQALLALKTSDYQNQPVAKFNRAVMDWANQNADGDSHIIENDLAKRTWPPSLTAEEQNFISLTIAASNTENGNQIKSYYTGKPPIDPDLSFELSREQRNADPPVWVNLMYGFSYRIDPDIITVGERDFALAAVVNDVQKFWDSSSVDTLAGMTPDRVADKLNEIIAAHSASTIKLSAVDNYFMFQSSVMTQ